MNFKNQKAFTRVIIEVKLLTTDEEFPGVLQYGKLFVNDVVTTCIITDTVEEAKIKAELFFEKLQLYITKETEETKAASREFSSVVKYITERPSGILTNMNEQFQYFNAVIQTNTISEPITIIEV